MSKLIVIEGTDCSGKETQANLLFERLKKETENLKKDLESLREEQELNIPTLKAVPKSLKGN